MAARPVGRAARLARACRRRPLVALLLGLLTVSLFGGLAGVTWKWLEANEQRDLANAQRTTRRLFQAYRARLSAAVAALQNHDVTDAARHLDAAPEALRGWEWRHLHSRLDDSIAVIPAPPSGTVLSPGPQGLRVLILADQSLRLLDEQGHAERTRAFPARERETLWVAAEAPEGLLILDRVSGTIARLRDPTGTVRVDVQMPADRYDPDVGSARTRTRLAIVWRGPGGFSAGGVRLLGEGTGPADRSPSRRRLVAGLQPRRHATGFGLGRRYRPAVGCGDRPADEWPAAPSGQRPGLQRSVPPRWGPPGDHLGRWHGVSVGRQDGSGRRAAL